MTEQIDVTEHTQAYQTEHTKAEFYEDCIGRIIYKAMNRNSLV